MQSVNLIFPHQLFKENPLIQNDHPVYLIEEFLFFNQYKFHKQKLALHRASMQFYKDYLEQKGKTVHYINAQESTSDIRTLLPKLAGDGIDAIHYIDPTDNWLEKRLKQGCQDTQINAEIYPNPLFLNDKESLKKFFRSDKKKFFQTEFYISQRKRLDILVENESPVGGKWSFDAENRKKYPRNKIPPAITFPKSDAYFEEAVDYVNAHYSDCPGELKDAPLYPHTFESSQAWLEAFFRERFAEFGPYEDAIVKEESILNHSVLTPMLNIGLLTPKQIIEATLDYIPKNEIPLNSSEGFIRQIIGWREFIRGVYEAVGTKERTRNYWGFERKIPASFYDGTTGIEPIDTTIKKLLNTGYLHHIERLMILGNFMVLCEFDPDEVYRWFMELFIDSYDWVMVPNVYGMSQFADGGLMATKPYISGSNYVLKMSNYKKGPWQETWDGLFWRFMHVNRDFFLKNPRLGMLIRTFDKMAEEKRTKHIQNAENFLEKLDQALLVSK